MKKPTLCNNTLATPTIPSNELWHYRLGHLSSNRLQILRDKFPFITIGNSNFPCDVCHYSKQKRLPYTQSTHNATQIFELIHLDIWGTIHCYFLAWTQIFPNYCG